MLHSERTKPVGVLVATILAMLPAAAGADVHVVQNSCRTNGPNPVVQFSFVNEAGTGASVCRIVIFPTSAECFPLACTPPADWSCFPGDVATFLQANNNSACIAPGATLGGFQLELTGDPCCLTFTYGTGDGASLGEEEFCFDCQTIGVDRQTWGGVKRLYE
jgi:hypothetical protein